jgi:hypothetical protein
MLFKMVETSAYNLQKQVQIHWDMNKINSVWLHSCTVSITFVLQLADRSLYAFLYIYIQI